MEYIANGIEDNKQPPFCSVQVPLLMLRCYTQDWSDLLWEEDPHSFTLALAFSLKLSLSGSRLDEKRKLLSIGIIAIYSHSS